MDQKIVLFSGVCYASIMLLWVIPSWSEWSILKSRHETRGFTLWFRWFEAVESTEELNRFFTPSLLLQLSIKWYKSVGFYASCIEWFFQTVLSISVHPKNSWKLKFDLWLIILTFLSQLSTAQVIQISNPPIQWLNIAFMIKYLSIGIHCILMAISYQQLLSPFPTHWRNYPRFVGSTDMTLSTVYGITGVCGWFCISSREFSFLSEAVQHLLILAQFFSLGHVIYRKLNLN